jgi:CRP-like cAMP-binding protein
MYVVTRGSLAARRGEAPARLLEAGAVIGELAVLADAPRAVTVTAATPAEVLSIGRTAFTAAARRSPELVLGLASSLAGWLAADRADVL